MIPLILFIVLGLVVLVATEWHERSKRKAAASGAEGAAASGAGETVASEQANERPEGCCGEHLVCERETLLQTNAEIVYYDDEELDALAGIAPEEYTPEQQEALRSVFRSLQESDVAGWCRSVQMRDIALPPDIREEALLIVRERRHLS